VLVPIDERNDAAVTKEQAAKRLGEKRRRRRARQEARGDCAVQPKPEVYQCRRIAADIARRKSHGGRLVHGAKRMMGEAKHQLTQRTSFHCVLSELSPVIINSDTPRPVTGLTAVLTCRIISFMTCGESPSCGRYAPFTGGPSWSMNSTRSGDSSLTTCVSVKCEKLMHAERRPATPRLGGGQILSRHIRIAWREFEKVIVVGVLDGAGECRLRRGRRSKRYCCRKADGNCDPVRHDPIGK
jgi:hypothetical protein